MKMGEGIEIEHGGSVIKDDKVVSEAFTDFFVNKINNLSHTSVQISSLANFQEVHAN